VLDEAAAKARHLRSAERVVRVEKGAPAAVAERGGLPGRVHDVGEQHGCQHALGVGHHGRRAGEELFDHVALAVLLGRIPRCHAGRRFDVSCFRDVLGDVTSAGARPVPPRLESVGGAPMHHENRRLDECHRGAHVPLGQQLEL
jgi:hypothetical protein